MKHMSKEKLPHQSSARYDRLKHELASLTTELGFALPGSVRSRFFECTRRNNCRCHDDPANRHGPYHYWTGKLQGRTMSVSLTDEQLARVQEWIENGRTLGRVVKQMQRESLRAFALLTG
ncbi:MAG TPA: DUF6788 family protein, partial [bacterium]|nr:DUF6788 family protein [bacterium]